MTRSHSIHLVWLCIAIGAWGGVSLSDARPADSAAPWESAARSVYREYVAAWVANDRGRVLSTLSADAVLMPSGVGQLEGIHAIESFWWPDDGSRSGVIRYASTIDDVRGGPSIAVIRAHGDLAFWYEKNGKREEHVNHNMSLTVIERQADGVWRITRRIWGSRERG